MKNDVFYPNTMTFYGNLTKYDSYHYESIYENPPQEEKFNGILWLSGNKIIFITQGAAFYGNASKKIPYLNETYLKPLIDKYVELYPITKS